MTGRLYHPGLIGQIVQRNPPAASWPDSVCIHRRSSSTVTERIAQMGRPTEVTGRGDRSGIVEGRDPATCGPGGSGASPARREATPSPRVAVEAADERGAVRQTRDERRRQPGPSRLARRSRAGRDPAGHRPGSRSPYGTDPHPLVWVPSGSPARAPEKISDAGFSPGRAHWRAPAVERQARLRPAEDPHDTRTPATRCRDQRRVVVARQLGKMVGSSPVASSVLHEPPPEDFPEELE